MKRILAIAVTLSALVGLTLASGTASAQGTTGVFVVHGLNLDGQSTQGAGGTNVTVCANDGELIPDFQFGQIVGPTELTTGEELNVKVYGGAGVDCAETTDSPLIDQNVTPTGDAVALVATSAGGTLALTPFPLDVSCSEEGGRLTAAHASGDTPEVSVLVAGDPVGNLTFGNSLDANLPASTYEVAVNLGEATVVGPADIPVEAGENTLVFVVGNIAGDTNTPVVPLVGSASNADCPTTTTTTPATPTTTPAAAPAGASTAPQAGGAPIGITG